jgi:hypothetical protein
VLRDRSCRADKQLPMPSSAARSGQVQTIRYLLDQGLSTTLDAKKDRLISYAASSGSLEALNTVSERGLDLSLRPRY